MAEEEGPGFGQATPVTPITTQDLDNAAALVEAAVRLLQQAKPVMERVAYEQSGGDQRTAAATLLSPIFGAALWLERAYEERMPGARAALEKVNHG